jgi:hypothetical protein
LISEARRLYRQLLSQNKHSSELLRYFAGFIEVTDSGDKAQKYFAQANKEADHIHSMTNARVVNYLDTHCSCFIVSFESANFGTVLWQKNCELLGLMGNEVLESKFKFLLPQLFEDLTEPRLNRLQKFDFGKTRKTYGLLKSGAVVEATGTSDASTPSR